MKKVLLLFLLVFILFNTSNAQKEKYQSLFIYNFTKYIKWPDSYNSGKFVIGVIGNSAVIESINSMATSKKKTGNGAAIEVRKYASISDIDDCNILFVSNNVIDQLVQIAELTAAKPILIITDTPKMATKGSVINFVETGGRIKFELNQSTAESRSLVISGSLISLAILI